MVGGRGDDTFVVDAIGDLVVEYAGEGNDTVYANADGHVLNTTEIEILSLNLGTAIAGSGNAEDNELYGNALDNVLDGRDGADELSGLGGNDTFMFSADWAEGDTVWDFTGNGAGAGDVLRFSGYGTLAQGATFTAIGGNLYQVTSANGLTTDTITVVGAVDASDVVFV
jgi:Ca2+-binding RTX toxin-like protein